MKLEEFALKAQYELKQGSYIKNSNDYNLMLYEIQQGYVRILTTIVCLSREVTKEELKEIQNRVGTKKIRYGVDGNKSVLLYLLDDLYGPVKEEKVNKVIENIYMFTSALRDLGITPQSKCIFCGLDKEDEEVVYENYNGLYLPQHLSCREKAKNIAVSKMNKDNANTKMYPLSIALASLGALLAALIINLLVIFVFDGTMYAIMYALVPIAAFFAYKLGKAPRNKKMVLYIILASIIGTLIIDFAFYSLAAAGLNISFSEFISANSGAILKQEATTILFLGIGVWISWGIITKTNDRDLKKF